jgi:N-acetylneuraminic acid mutarotase
MRIALAACALLSLISCGGGGGGGGGAGTGPAGSGTATYTIGGTVSGLASGASVVLQEGQSEDQTITANGAFSFPEPMASGSKYSVAILTQPGKQKCSVYNPIGTVATADVTDLYVVCLANAWTWMDGASTSGASGQYGTKGSASASDVPGARQGAVSWTDASGNLWLFGGSGIDQAGNAGELNDFWLYCPCSGAWVWTWMGGTNSTAATGVYGTLGSAAPGNFPGSRQGASAWKDSYGNFWLFGGTGLGAAGAQGGLNDLWKYTPSVGTWAWINGPTSTNSSGVYAAGGGPGARSGAASWTDAAGNLWLFGGNGYAASGTPSQLNDLWTYSTSDGTWTWISGASTTNAAGVYGSMGTAAAGNVPGARQGASAWLDASGRLWLFGGLGYDSTGTLGALGDLWNYTPATQSAAGAWTWVGGSQFANTAGTYGTLGRASSGNAPGARQSAHTWLDSSGTLWLMGGVGVASAATSSGELNDLWQYSASAGTWTWVSGSNAVNGAPRYGTRGTASPSNQPGARSAGVTWVDPLGNLWLVGGLGLASNGLGSLNDMWEYTP